MEVHVPAAITDALPLRGIDVLTGQDDGQIGGADANVAVGKDLRQLLDRPWRITGDRGPNLQAELLNNGRFLVSGLSPELPEALRKKPGNNAAKSRDHTLP